MHSYITISKKKISLILIALMYSFCFIFAYKYFLNEHFEYLRYTITSRSWGIWFLTLLISITPIIVFHGIRTISSLISIILYILLYVPTIITFAFGSTTTESELIVIELVFYFSMCLIFYADRFSFKNIFPSIAQKLTMNFFLFLTLFFILIAIWFYRGNLSFVSFNDVYIQRTATNYIGENNSFIAYLITWLINFLVPLCLSYGIVKKSIIFVFAGIVGSIVTYMAIAAKGALLMPIYIYILYLLIKKFDVEKFHFAFTYTISLLLVTLTLLTKTNNIWFFGINSLFTMRTISIGGLLNVAYYEFFTNHPLTYLSHVGLINKLTGNYSYENQSLGIVIGSNVFNSSTNANANFWATDGIASFGIFGVIFISIIFFIFLILLNSITKNYNKTFIILLFVPFIGTLLNTSFFTSLLSGGGLFMIFALALLNKNSIK